ncbi:nucleotidyltransferase family protein [Bacillus alkalicellulosilyticus]|uniref:nucleotidyltransferase family protein n=1 Tax=Alkalihalobacterium alkalicellulosilyticum TaxID=1912214 RepID=UPI000998999F|nr:nucleotidyltransferase family protein [Bacillus alkalicellulosilyticus]
MNTNYLDNEERLVLMLAKKNLSKEERGILIQLMESHLDWERIMGSLSLHRIKGIAWSNLKKIFGRDFNIKLTYPNFFKELDYAYRYQMLKAKENMKLTLEVCNEFEKNNVKHVVLKGFVSSSVIYNDFGMREFGDNDILIHSSQLEQALTILKDKGYTQGNYNVINDEITEASRREKIVRTMVSHEVIPLVHKGNPILPHHEVDLQFSIDLMTGNKTDMEVQQLLNRRVEMKLGEGSFYTLDLYDFLIFLCIHFYKEAISLMEVLHYGDLNLYKLCDIYYLIEDFSNINWKEFLFRIQQLNVEKEVYYSLHYVINIFDLMIPVNIIKAISPKNLDYINEVYYYNNENVAHVWGDPIIKRIFNIDRVKQIKVNEEFLGDRG